MSLETIALFVASCPSNLSVPVIAKSTFPVAVLKSNVALLLPSASTVSVPTIVAFSKVITSPGLTVKLFEEFTVNKFSTTTSFEVLVEAVPAMVKL